jgi:hypothetical protein
MENPNVSAEDLVKEILRINNKDYKDSASYQHAIKNYECAGSLVSVKKGSGGFELTGYTNANGGAVVKFTIYMIAAEIVQVQIISPIQTPEQKQGVQQMTGVAGGAATFVMKYSGFGKLSRALTNFMEGKDPWTGKEGSTLELTVGGITDLLTMGMTVRDVAINMALSITQEGLERYTPEQLEEIGLTREVVDVLLSETKLEQRANIIQGILAGKDNFKKWFWEEETNNNNN